MGVDCAKLRRASTENFGCAENKLPYDGRMSKTARTKLAAWFAAYGMKKGHFAGLVPVTPGNLSDWLTGRVTPSRIARARIEQITAGEVLATDWDDKAALQSRLS